MESLEPIIFLPTFATSNNKTLNNKHQTIKKITIMKKFNKTFAAAAIFAATLFSAQSANAQTILDDNDDFNLTSAAMCDTETITNEDAFGTILIDFLQGGQYTREAERIIKRMRIVKDRVTVDEVLTVMGKSDTDTVCVNAIKMVLNRYQ